MKAIILAAGKSTRTYPLTLTRPKPLLKVCGKTIIEHNLEQLQGLVSEAIIVVGYLGEQIKEKIGSNFGKIKIKYIEQEQQDGTGSALEKCKVGLDGKFIVMNGDDFYSRNDIENCLQHKYSVLVQDVRDPQNFGIAETKNKTIVVFEEKPEKPKSNLANTGLYVFDKKVFDINLDKSKRGEYEITDYLKYLIKNEKVIAKSVEGYWVPIVFSWSLFNINSIFLEKSKAENNGKIDENAKIKGKLVLGEGSVIKSGVVIEDNVWIGKNCVIGPNCYIRGDTSIGDNSRIGNAVEIKNSIIGDNVNISHLSYIGDSIIGNNVNIGGGTMIANLRFDSGEIAVKVNGKIINCKRGKLGAIIADGVKTGINVSIMPGSTIEPNKTVNAGEVYKN